VTIDYANLTHPAPVAAATLRDLETYVNGLLATAQCSEPNCAINDAIITGIQVVLTAPGSGGDWTAHTRGLRVAAGGYDWTWTFGSGAIDRIRLYRRQLNTREAVNPKQKEALACRAYCTDPAACQSVLTSACVHLAREINDGTRLGAPLARGSKNRGKYTDETPDATRVPDASCVNSPRLSETLGNSSLSLSIVTVTVPLGDRSQSAPLVETEDIMPATMAASLRHACSENSICGSMVCMAGAGIRYENEREAWVNSSLPLDATRYERFVSDTEAVSTSTCSTDGAIDEVTELLRKSRRGLGRML
jgi:hypothetical protein